MPLVSYITAPRSGIENESVFPNWAAAFTHTASINTSEQIATLADGMRTSRHSLRCKDGANATYPMAKILIRECGRRDSARERALRVSVRKIVIERREMPIL